MVQYVAELRTACRETVLLEPAFDVDNNYELGLSGCRIVPIGWIGLAVETDSFSAGDFHCVEGHYFEVGASGYRFSNLQASCHERVLPSEEACGFDQAMNSSVDGLGRNRMDPNLRLEGCTMLWAQRERTSLVKYLVHDNSQVAAVGSAGALLAASDSRAASRANMYTILSRLGGVSSSFACTFLRVGTRAEAYQSTGHFFLLLGMILMLHVGVLLQRTSLEGSGISP